MSPFKIKEANKVYLKLTCGYKIQLKCYYSITKYNSNAWRKIYT